MGLPEDVELFEKNLQELIVKYEQYFLGLEKRAPLKLLDQVERTSRKYLGIHITNTMLKFRFNSLVARLNSYRQYWERINRLIEEGKYSRDRFKMALHTKERDAEALQGKPAISKPTVNTEAQELYREYIAARKACRLPVENITPEAIAAAIDKHRPSLSAKYQSGVEFKVVIEDGKPRIKARSKL